jgi:DNA-binding NarL/FixJ family response regulator
VNNRGEVCATKVLVVDDQTLYREGLIGLMAHWPDFQVIGDAANGKEAVEFCRSNVPDLILMDIQMPVMNGIEATKIIREICPDVIIVMLTISVEENDLVEAFMNGASGYVLKDLLSSQLRGCLQGAVRGDTVVSGSITSVLIDKALKSATRASLSKHDAALNVDLNAREIDILRLVAQGFSNEEIGTKMYISPGTVKKNLQALMQKLQLSNRVMLAVYAVRAGLLD